ncbi:hypothetical protein NQ315_010587 [Exocentrus adspersus]|uniref:Uncharacterized protein n=1 Tax=Exocentrus adspersus TaxID=1586481 RepID=A0AAV8W5F8_9CUCU|nr:hypothetical protein NQ315_010587 [Exocentrus adspersus]
MNYKIRVVIPVLMGRHHQTDPETFPPSRIIDGSATITKQIAVAKSSSNIHIQCSWAISTVLDLLIIRRFGRHSPAVFRGSPEKNCWLPIPFRLWTLYMLNEHEYVFTFFPSTLPDPDSNPRPTGL